MISQYRLKKVVSYNPSTGIFTWLPRGVAEFSTLRAARSWNARYAGTIAGSIHRPEHCNSVTAYREIMIDSTKYKAHRLAWQYTYGDKMPKIVDHIDGYGLNNAISNLRSVDDEGSARNKRQYKNNKSGTTGVYWHKGRKAWTAAIGVGKGKQKHLGYFDTPEAAAKVRQQAQKELTGYSTQHGEARWP